MKKRIIALLLMLALSLGLLTGCGAVESARTVNTPPDDLVLIEDEQEQSEEITDTDETETALPEEEQPQIDEEEAEVDTVSEDGEYTSPEEVAEYIHIYGHLPSNYITKNEARKLGWTTRPEIFGTWHQTRASAATASAIMRDCCRRGAGRSAT